MEKINNLSKFKKFNFLLLAFILLFSFHLFPFFLIGDLIIYIPDVLNYWIPQNFIAGKVLFGEIEASNLFLNGELPWQFIYGSLFFINILYKFIDINSAYILIDVIIRTVGFLSFFYFIKKYESPLLLKILASCLFSSFLITSSWGLGMASFPYVLAVCLKKKISLKNFLAISIIALNTDLYLHGIYIYLAIFLYLCAFFKIIKINYKNLVKIFLVYTPLIIISNFNLLYSVVAYSPFQLIEQNAVFNLKDAIYENLLALFIPQNNNIYFYPNIFLILFLNFSILFSFFKRIEINYFIFKLLIFFQLTTIFFSIVQNIELFPFLKGSSLTRIVYLLPFFHSLIIFNFIRLLKSKKLYLVYSFLIVSIIYNQISPSAFTVAKEMINYDQISEEGKSLIKKNYENYEFMSLIHNVRKFKIEKRLKENDFIRGSSYATSINSYYRFEDYKVIKDFVKNNRTYSIGLDPFKAVVSDIMVVGGYYRYYPSKYKEKYFKIIKDQIEFIETSSDNFRRKELIKSFKNKGMRLYSYTEKNDEIKINFNQLNRMNINYIISKFQINNSSLTAICNQCNGNRNLYLYSLK